MATLPDWAARVIEALVAGDPYEIRGFGRFVPSVRRTMDLDGPRRVMIVFYGSDELKAAMNEGGPAPVVPGLEAIVAGLLAGQPTTVSGFGTFKVSHRRAFKGHDPWTGADMVIPERSAVDFRAQQSVRDALNAPPDPWREPGALRLDHRVQRRPSLSEALADARYAEVHTLEFRGVTDAEVAHLIGGAESQLRSVRLVQGTLTARGAAVLARGRWTALERLDVDQNQLSLEAITVLRALPGDLDPGVQFGGVDVSVLDEADEADVAALVDRWRRLLEDRMVGVMAALDEIPAGVDPRPVDVVTRRLVSRAEQAYARIETAERYGTDDHQWVGELGETVALADGLLADWREDALAALVPHPVTLAALQAEVDALGS
ncbi:MAG: HU family DNA-binding protein [Myxococcota bacterium]